MLPVNAYRASFPSIQLARSAASSCCSPPPSALSFTEPLLSCRRALLASEALNRLSRGLAAGENRGLPPLSIVGSFSPQPWLASVGDSVAPDGCHLVLVAARAPRAVSREDAQSGNRLATTPGGPEAVKPVGTWPRSVLPALPRHVGPSDSLAR